MDPTSANSIRAKLDQLAIKEMTKALSKVDASKKINFFKKLTDKAQDINDGDVTNTSKGPTSPTLSVNKLALKS